MNKVVLIGRLTREVEMRYSSDERPIARYTLAVDRRFKKGEADFIPCVTFGKGAEFAGKYLHKGTKIAVSGRIQTGSYEKKDGSKVYTTDIVIEDQEFVESKPKEEEDDGFMDVKPGEMDELAFV